MKVEIFSLIIDVVAILIGLFIIFDGYRKGFLRSIVLVVGYVVAILAAVYFSKILSSFLYDNFIRTSIMEKIDEIINTTSKDSLRVPVVITALLAKLPSFLSNQLISQFGGEEQLISDIQSKTQGVVSDIGTIITDDVIAPIILSMLGTILCLILFTLFAIIVKTIAKMFQGFYAIPILGSVNSMLGGALGIVQACIFLCVAAFAVFVIISVTSNKLGYLNTDIIANTNLFKHFYNLVL